MGMNTFLPSRARIRQCWQRTTAFFFHFPSAAMLRREGIAAESTLPLRRSTCTMTTTPTTRTAQRRLGWGLFWIGCLMFICGMVMVNTMLTLQSAKVASWTSTFGKQDNLVPQTMQQLQQQQEEEEGTLPKTSLIGKTSSSSSSSSSSRLDDWRRRIEFKDDDDNNDDDDATATAIKIMEISLMKSASEYTNVEKSLRTGCGLSMRVLFGTTKTTANHNHNDNKTMELNATTAVEEESSSSSSSSVITSVLPAFFKVQVASNKSYHDAESHLREIMACHLDELLQTNVVPPCVGYELDLSQLSTSSTKIVPNWNEKANHEEGLQRLEDIYQHGACAIVETTNYRTNATSLTLPGSLMEWSSSPLESIDRYQVGHMATTTMPSSEFSNSTIDSAVRYAVFHYLGACMKSDHNHFYARRKKQHRKHDDDDLDEEGSVGGMILTAIDNDRCLTPSAVYQDPNVPASHYSRIQMWREIVLEQIPCNNFAVDLKERIFHLSSSSMTTPNPPLSFRLQQSLQQDVLAAELLSYQAESFPELDDRIAIFAKRLFQHCDSSNNNNNTKQNITS